MSSEDRNEIFGPGSDPGLRFCRTMVPLKTWMLMRPKHHDKSEYINGSPRLTRCGQLENEIGNGKIARVGLALFGGRFFA
jgi:hypothetical protein